jgi:hypothetical protein
MLGAAYTVRSALNILPLHLHVFISVQSSDLVGDLLRAGLSGILYYTHSATPSLGLTRSSVKCIPGLFPGDKAAGAWCQPPTPN